MYYIGWINVLYNSFSHFKPRHGLISPTETEASVVLANVDFEKELKVRQFEMSKSFESLAFDISKDSRKQGVIPLTKIVGR